MIENITRPTLLLDKNKCFFNIKKMAKKAKDAGIDFRPHFKTHQSKETANWFRDFGVNKITVSSFDMAAYFANAGWNDILIAFPFNILELARLRELSSKIKISVLIDNSDTLHQLKALENSVHFYIDVDTGYGRTGIPAENTTEIEEVIKTVQSIKNLEFSGFYCHAGHSYKTNNRAEKDKIHQKALQNLNSLKTIFKEHAPKALYGDTPNCSIQTDFSGIDTITPGNFVFYDLFQYSIGSCTEDEITVAMACPVVGKYKRRNEVVMHGGAVHFSKETINIDGKNVFGKRVQQEKNYWKPYPEDIYITSVSQEHGIVKVNSVELEKISIGDILLFVPIHSCLTANLMRSYRTLEGSTITML